MAPRVALLMDHVTGEVLALLNEGQALRKARTDPHRKDIQFAPGTRCCLTLLNHSLPATGFLPVG